MRRWRTMAAALATSTALALSSVGAAEAADAAPAGLSDGLARAAFVLLPGFAGLPDSASLHTPVILHGNLQDNLGRGLPGAQVLLSAWPSNETIHALPIGSYFQVVPITRTVSGPDGSYTLRSLLTPALASLVGLDGLDLQLDVFQGGRHFVQLTQAMPDRGIGGWALATATKSLESALSAGANERNRFNVTLAPATGTVVSQALLAGDPPPPFKHVAAPGCTNFQKIAVRSAMTTVATGIARNGVTMKATYTRESKTQIDTGGSAGGVFTVSGARTRTARAAVEFLDQVSQPGQAINRDFRLRWDHTVAKRECARDYRGNYDVTYLTSPDRASGGATDVPSAQASWTCPRFDPANPTQTVEANAAVLETDDEQARTVGGAFSFAPLGKDMFTGAATSGYSEDVKMTFLPKNPRSAYWCGDSGAPLAGGQRVQAFQQ